MFTLHIRQEGHTPYSLRGQSGLFTLFEALAESQLIQELSLFWEQDILASYQSHDGDCFDIVVQHLSREQIASLERQAKDFGNDQDTWHVQYNVVDVAKLDVMANHLSVMVKEE